MATANASLTTVEMSSSTHGRLPVFALGPWQQGEFQIVRRQLDPLENWPLLGTLEQALADLVDQPISPEVMLLAQPRPGFYQQTLLDTFQALAPLTRIIVVAGTWCEGELRSGKPLYGVQRFYWYEFAAWWRQATTLWSAGKCPPWSLPNSDIQTRCLPSKTKIMGLVEIDSQDYETYAALSAAVSPYGWSTVWQPRGRCRAAAIGTSAGIWDGGQLDPSERDQLAEFCHKLQKHDARVTVLLDFPRVEHLRLANDLGAKAVLAKPYFLDDLLNAIGGSATAIP